jgi:peptidoglycan-N-acetylglucosamine deacetylase
MNGQRKRILVLSMLLALATALLLFQLSKSRTFQLMGKIVSRVETDRKIVALTFDDGPTERTDTVLRILDRYGVHATFFLTGSEMKLHPDYLKKIVAARHAVGNHSFSHKPMLLCSNAFVSAEISSTDQLIRQAGFAGNIYFRPPFCKKLVMLPRYLSATHRTTVTWDLEPDSVPGSVNDTGKIIQVVKDQVKPGSIILLHVMYKSRTATIAALPHIIEWLQQNGYTLVTVNELIEGQANRPT